MGKRSKESDTGFFQTAVSLMRKKDYSISENKRIREDLMTMPVPPLPDIWQGRQFFCPYPVNVVKYDIRMKNKGGRSENV